MLETYKRTTWRRTVWPTERIDKLGALLDDGYSASQAAAEMGCTRNSVIGIAHRNQMAFKSAAMRPKAPPRTATPRRRTPFRPQASHETTAPLLLPTLDEDAAVSPTQRRSLLELKDYHCRWPHGDVGTVDFHFCGGMVIEGAPYCEHHCRLAYRRPRQREEQAA